jgi:hypothetical protein
VWGGVGGGRQRSVSRRGGGRRAGAPLRATCFTTQRSASSASAVPSTANRILRPLVEGSPSGEGAVGAEMGGIPMGRPAALTASVARRAGTL